MAQRLFLYIGADGVPQEHDNANDEITLASFTVTGGGPVLSATGLDGNNTDISDINDLSFTDPTTDGITRTDGTHAADDLMVQTVENVMTTSGAILFPTVTDVADEVDALRTPTIAGVPTATPADGGEGYLLWDNTGDRLFAWTGTEWDDLSTVQAAERVENIYTAEVGITDRDAVYISSADNVSPAQGDTIANARAIGFARATVLAAADVAVQSEGVMDGFSGLTAGAPQYLDPSTAGAITETVPTGTGNVIVQMGYAKSATELHIQIDRLGRRA
jgi:hypothetical protein